MKPTMVATSAVAVATLVAGCGTTSTVSPNSAPSGLQSALAQKHYSYNPGMTLHISPDHGPKGTTVELTVSGCGDPTGRNHALSYNDSNATAMTPQGQAAGHLIPSPLNGTSIRTSYVIPATGGPAGTFYMQCGATTLGDPFTVTAN